MADKLDRLEQDRALFTVGNRQQMVDIIDRVNPQLIVGELVKVLQLSVMQEEIARAKGVTIDEAALEGYMREHGSHVEKQADKALNAFIHAIVTKEG